MHSSRRQAWYAKKLEIFFQDLKDTHLDINSVLRTLKQSWLGVERLSDRSFIKSRQMPDDEACFPFLLVPFPFLLLLLNDILKTMKLCEFV